MPEKKHILPVIVIAQFLCTSLWFAGNAVMPELIRTFSLESESLGHLTSMVQFGFIAGTLVFALFSVADRFAPSNVFLCCAIAGALVNGLTIWEGNTLPTLLGQRFLTGFFLAGIYPVGMKIAADYFDSGLGKSLGYLVGALVLGTAFPHLLRGMFATLPWKLVLTTTSLMAVTGGMMMKLLVPDGPFRKSGQRIDLTAAAKVFRNREFRAAAIGYFGHMWELYAFWAFVPVMLKSYAAVHPSVTIDLPFWSFLIIGIGGPACVAGSLLSQRLGIAKTATLALLVSGICCLVSGFAFFSSETVFLAFLLFWGITVIADSPLFSTLVAVNAAPEVKGTALTIVTCIGFAITIASIQLLTLLSEFTRSHFIFAVLAIGPAIGLISMRLIAAQRNR